MILFSAEQKHWGPLVAHFPIKYISKLPVLIGSFQIDTPLVLAVRKELERGSNMLPIHS